MSCYHTVVPMGLYWIELLANSDEMDIPEVNSKLRSSDSMVVHMGQQILKVL